MKLYGTQILMSTNKVLLEHIIHICLHDVTGCFLRTVEELSNQNTVHGASIV
jgi:hypothetical protein